MDGIDESWWKEAVVYEVYPRSFKDSDSDGVGDIAGITEKVDYLDDLGVDLVWMCPVYDSPQADNGYDIRDYRAVDEEFGTMADLEELVSTLHDHDIRFIMDLVLNHTSDEHEWFQRSRREEADYADYYHWVDGEPDEPPNNWDSIFGGPAWTYDDEREAWYLHLFHEKQPDLNWRNPDVRADVYEMVNWWLDWGVDGFRLDAVNLLSKPAGYPDGERGTDLIGREHFFNGPRIHEYLSELTDETFAGRDVVSVAEMGAITPDHVAEYTGEDGDGLDMVFQFLWEDLDEDGGPDGVTRDWSLSQLKTILDEWQGVDDGWVAPCLGNHDQPRTVSSWGDEAYRAESATMLATFLLTLRGTPHVYQGEEIGMVNAEFDGLDEIDDPETHQFVRLAIEEGDADTFDDVREAVNQDSRDHARTPMQWSDAENAGFTDGAPWLKVNDNYPEVNVETERADDGSIWHYYHELLALRHQEDVLVYGDFDLVAPDDERLCAYTRTLDGDTMLVVCNWSDDSAALDDATLDGEDADVLVGNYDHPPTNPVGGVFRPYEAVVYRL